MLAHIAGIPAEETALSLGPIVTVTAAVERLDALAFTSLRLVAYA
jgi:hypothetical protein